MYPTNWLENKTASMRLTDGDVDLIASEYEEITGTSEQVDFRKFFFKLFDRALSRKSKEVVREVEIPANIPEGSFLVSPDKTTRALLNTCVELESKRLKRQVLPEEILLTLFSTQIIQGPGDWLPRRWNRSELIKIRDNALSLIHI